ncbi:bacteriocin-processing peptidase family protein [Shewanella psychromarinicola]|uniref:Bacteriocin-processing peptidase family protein n=2 Tax=Shewanellaceae TaxID=267890 RepID=A0A3N4ELA0_9GAMM|nr:bacteriocin-processing peptidase family protein [Shewanella psychromarinicola]RPA35010.1 bacteriocin-processing peptidase family protein [Shewanella psychromarinicola]
MNAISMFTKAMCITGFCLFLSGCLSIPPQTAILLANPPAIAHKHQITGVPFYPQEDYFCGPTTLAEVFNFYGVIKTPQQIAPALFIPELQGSLQIEMVAAARQQGLLAYAESGNLTQLLSLVSENIPVIILQNVSTSWYPMWHYAVVTGYDLDKQYVRLHSGTNKNRIAELKVFERTWLRGQYWLLAAVPADKTSLHFDPFIYASAAQDLLSSGKSTQGISALENATRQWPDYWLSYFLLGNYYLAIDNAQAAFWYQQGLTYIDQQAEQQAAYLNNFAYSLSLSGCKPRAMEMIEKARRLQPEDSNIRSSQKDIEKMPDNASCSVN